MFLGLLCIALSILVLAGCLLFGLLKIGKQVSSISLSVGELTVRTRY